MSSPELYHLRMPTAVLREVAGSNGDFEPQAWCRNGSAHLRFTTPAARGRRICPVCKLRLILWERRKAREEATMTATAKSQKNMLLQVNMNDLMMVGANIGCHYRIINDDDPELHYHVTVDIAGKPLLQIPDMDLAERPRLNRPNYLNIDMAVVDDWLVSWLIEKGIGFAVVPAATSNTPVTR